MHVQRGGLRRLREPTERPERHVDLVADAVHVDDACAFQRLLDDGASEPPDHDVPKLSST
jgi:hypothetical protein